MHIWDLIQRWIAAFLVICLTVSSLYGIWAAIDTRMAYDIPALTTADLEKQNLSQVKHLMIVAHPDDETLWGGAHLLDGGYLVVCITNGNNQIRAAEFQVVMKQSGNIGLILSYPDKVGGKRDNWMHIRTQLTKDLTRIMTYQSWDRIVTHNAAGEYGHLHHKMTHEIVTNIYDMTNLEMPLYVFGKYYRAAALPEVQTELEEISQKALQKKEALLALYTSQNKTITSLSHMNPYEMWTIIRNGGSHETPT